jgi:drug/metabolite transporter (DMT)-like permease
MDVLSIGCAVGAAIGYGLASVLQARGARSVPATEGVDPRLLVRLTRSAPFLAGVALDTLAFVLQLVALRTLPIFLVQATVAANLAVTALGATILLRERLGRFEWGAVVAVCVGLAALAAGAGAEGARRPPVGFFIGLTGAVAVLVLVALAGRWLPQRGRTAWLGAGAGIAFGVVALAARTLPSLDPVRLLVEPATYLVLAGGVLGFLLYTTALQGGSVTAATAAVVVGETIIPAVLGVLVLGDRARPGAVWLAVGGFVLAVAGALSLSRFGEPDSHPT